MKDKEVLQKAIEIAMENGMSHYYNWMLSVLKDWLGDIENGHIGSYEEQFHINEIIFSHDFAKAFWGESKEKFANIYCEWVRQNNFDKEKIHLTGLIHDWQYHLQQMVLEENPIDYLRKFIEE